MEAYTRYKDKRKTLKAKDTIEKKSFEGFYNTLEEDWSATNG